MSLGDLFSRLEGLTARINGLLKAIFEEDQGFFGEVGVYSLLGGGKRLRPLIFCLSYQALGLELDDDAVKEAASFELLHMATLMHDDIIDQSDLRRGRSAAHRVFGIPETVMAADYLIAKAGLMNMAKSSLETMRLMVCLLRDLSYGELAELKARREADLTSDRYMDIIYKKTAALLETVGRAAAIIGEADEKSSKALSDYGRLLGLGFQITDDVLDYQAQVGKLGKPVGQDLAEGRITLPFIMAREALTGADRQRLIELGSMNPLEKEHLDEVRLLLDKGQGIEKALAEARRLAEEAAQALKALAPSPERELLADLALYSVERDR
jgi:octaprenyl-diphosphate synthase